MEERPQTAQYKRKIFIRSFSEPTHCYQGPSDWSHLFIGFFLNFLFLPLPKILTILPKSNRFKLGAVMPFHRTLQIAHGHQADNNSFKDISTIRLSPLYIALDTVWWSYFFILFYIRRTSQRKQWNCILGKLQFCMYVVFTVQGSIGLTWKWERERTS